MANISADPKQITNYGNQIINKAAEYKKEINAIYSTVDTLKTNWTGAASQRFVDEIESFREEYKKFGELIGEFGNLLVEVGKAYDDLENNL